jgi:hypothetical protein
MKLHRPLIALALFAAAGPLAPAVAQENTAPAFEGVAAGWIYDSESAAASTTISSEAATGFVMLFCEASRLGFYIALDDPGLADGAHDGLLQIYPLSPGAEPFAQFSVRLFAPEVFRSTRFRTAEHDAPERALAALRDLPGGMRLRLLALREDRFTPPLVADLRLPRESTGSGLDLEIGLALVQERCRRG